MRYTKSMEHQVKQNGFLLISLIIVVAIIAILVAVSWGGSGQTKKDGTPGDAQAPSDNSASILIPNPQGEIPTAHSAIDQARNVTNQAKEQNKQYQQQVDQQYK